MGTRFRKSVKIAPGVKLNVGKKSVGVSVGGKHGGVSMNSRNGARARVSAPGTGLSYSEKIGERKNSRGYADEYEGEYDDGPGWEDMTELEQAEYQLGNLKASTTILKILTPIFSVLFLLLCVLGPAYIILAAAVIGGSIWLLKKYKKKISELEDLVASLKSEDSTENLPC